MEGDTSNPQRNWGLFTLIAMLAAVAVGLIYYYYNGNIIVSISFMVLIIGIYLLISSMARDSTPDRWGTSDAYAGAMGGFLLIAIGGAGIVNNYADSIIIPIVYIIVIMILAAAYTMAKKKR